MLEAPPRSSSDRRLRGLPAWTPQILGKLKIAETDRLLGFWDLMSYDYAGSWDQTAGHQANLFPSRANPASTPFSTIAALERYARGDVHASKIVLGMPMYGRASTSTLGTWLPLPRRWRG